MDSNSPFGYDSLLKKCFDKCGNNYRFEESEIAGLLHYNQCDDGNETNGDGCSDTCQIEDGFFCIKSSKIDGFTGSALFDVTALDPGFAKIGVNLAQDKDVCYYIGNIE